MSNFESGPVKLTGDQPLRWEDAAKAVTVSGFACAMCGRFYGDNERAARYCCHTDAPCPTCGGRKSRHHVKCENCYHKDKVKRYADMKQSEDRSAPSSLCPLSILDGDEYFFDEESLYDYCDRHNLKPSDLFLVYCLPSDPPVFAVEDYVADFLCEDGEAPGDPAEIAAVNKAVNDYLDRHRPFSWGTDYGLRPTDAMLAAFDKEIAT